MSEFIRSLKEGHNYNTDSINLPNQIQSIVLDFEHMIYEINGKGIGLADELNISFRDGTWKINMSVSRMYSTKGCRVLEEKNHR